jgi:hypothetical protein
MYFNMSGDRPTEHLKPVCQKRCRKRPILELCEVHDTMTITQLDVRLHDAFLLGHLNF